MIPEEMAKIPTGFHAENILKSKAHNLNPYRLMKYLVRPRTVISGTFSA